MRINVYLLNYVRLQFIINDHSNFKFMTDEFGEDLNRFLYLFKENVLHAQFNLHA